MSDNGSKDYIVVVIPAYNVKREIAGVIQAIGQEVKRIIVVDDACPQQSGKHVEKTVEDERVEVIYHEKNLGVGGAVISGIKAAMHSIPKNACIVKVDGDGQHDPAMIGLLVRPIFKGEADYVKGNRFYRLEDVRKMPFSRKIGNAALSFFSKLSSGYWGIFDPTNGFVAIHAEILAQLPLNKISNDYFFESDMLFRLNLIKAKVLDIPMAAHYGKERSNMRPFTMVPYFIRRHALCTVKRFFYSYFLRDFTIGSILLLFGGLSFLIGSLMGLIVWWTYLNHETGAPTGMVILPALLIILGFQMLLGFLTADVAAVPQEPIHPRLIRHLNSKG